MSEFDAKPHVKKLVDYIDSSAYEEAIKTCSYILEKQNEPEILTTKIMCYLELGHFKELIEFLSTSAELSKKFCFEHAYAQFSLNQHKEAIEFINSHEKEMIELNKTGKFLLEAQIHFCLGNYSECVKIYEHLIHSEKKKDREIFTNYIASLILSKNSQKAVSKEVIKLVSQHNEEEEDEGEEESMYELYFNISSAHAENFNIDEALNLLNRSKREQMKSSSSPSASLLVLEGYISQIDGDEGNARDLYEKVIKGKSIEKANVGLAVAGNNLVSIYRGNQSVYEINRRLKFAFSERVSGKLTTWQERGIYLNKVLWLLQMKNFDGCEKMFEDLEKKFPGTDIPTLINASLSYKKKDHEKAIEILKNYLDKNRGSSEKEGEACANVEVSLAQIYLNKGMTDEALRILRSSTIRNYPSVVGCVVGLYRKTFAASQLKKGKGKQGKGEGGEETISAENFIKTCLEVFGQAIEFWNGKYEKSSRHRDTQKLLVTVLNANAEFLFSLGRFEEAIQTYEKIIEMNPRDADRFKACLVNVLVSSVNRVKSDSQKKDLVSKIRNLAKELPEIELPKKWDLSFLERINVRKVKEKKAEGDQQQGTSGSEVGGGGQGGKKKKKRKNPKPKRNFDPNKQPDEERWLPKWERSGYKKTKKRWQGARVDGGLDSTSGKKKKAGKKELTKEQEIAKKLKEKGKALKKGTGGASGGGKGKKKKGKKK